jgi:CubicO group peptidase (beta-lactamase class C family)
MRLAAAFLALLLATGCGTAPSDPGRPVADSGQAYVPGPEWRTASPAAVGIDPERITALERDIDGTRYGSLHGVLVVRFGHLVLEHYKAWSREQPHTMQSVTKSVTSLLLGILATRNPAAAGNLDRPVLDVFPRYSDLANLDDNKRALTLRHLVTMRTSMDFWEQPYPGSPLEQLNRSNGDWVKFILDRPMTGAPGHQWAYNSGAAILSGAIIREIAGVNVDQFAREQLFAPIGVRGETWFRSPYDGLPHCGGGLGLRAVDLARIGYLVLRRGRWGDREVVPASWIDQSTSPDSRGPPVYFSNFGSAYGYFWWLFPTSRGGTDLGVIAASGSGGQWLFVVPERDLVVAVVSEANGNGIDRLSDLLNALR